MNEAEAGLLLPKWAAASLVLLIIFLMLAPWPVTVWSEYGDADAAWDGIVALLWGETGRLPTDSGVFVEERFRSSPLSIWMTGGLLRLGWIVPPAVPWVMNVATALAGLAIPVLLFRTLRRLLGQGPTLLALVLLLSSPVFFRLRCYGLPTLPAFALFVGSLLCFEVAGRSTRPRRWLAGSFLLLVLAVLVKVDVILLGPAFAVIAWYRGSRGPVAWAAWLMPIAAVLCWHLFCQAVAPGAPQTAETFQNWSGKWRLVPAGLIGRANLLNMAMAPGFGTLALTGAALVPTLSRKRFSFLAAVLVCTVPTVLFWGMREMNSSRHNFWIVVPLAILASTALAERLARRPRVCLAALLGVIAVNYLVGPRQENFRLAPARFYAASLHRAEVNRRYHEKYGMMFGDLAGDRICVHSMSEETAHALAVWLAMADRSEVRVVGSRQNDWRVHSWRGGREYRLWMPDRDLPPGERSALEADGWIVRRGG